MFFNKSKQHHKECRFVNTWDPPPHCEGIPEKIPGLCGSQLLRWTSSSLPRGWKPHTLFCAPYTDANIDSHHMVRYTLVTRQIDEIMCFDLAHLASESILFSFNVHSNKAL